MPQTITSANKNDRELRSSTSPKGAADLLISAFLAILSTAIFYEVFPLPLLEKDSLLALFDNSISEIIIGFTFCSFFLLGLRYKRFRRELRLQKHLSSTEAKNVFSNGVQPWQVKDTLLQLQNLPLKKTSGLLISTAWLRIQRLLRHQPSVHNKESLTSFLDSQSELDLKKLEASYTPLRVFIWAIPILGFIGTVLGIGDAVGEFASFIENTSSNAAIGDEIRGALAGVTSGLAVAFNTTFLALILVVPVMMLSSFLQKNEEELLIALEEYCLEHILPHLQVADSIAPDENYKAHLNQLTQLSQAWVNELKPLVNNLSTQSQTMNHQLAGLQPVVRQFTERLLKQKPPSELTTKSKKTALIPPVSAQEPTES